MIQRAWNHRGSRPRRGITLIELLVLLTGVAVMLGLCAVTIQLFLRLNIDSQARVNSTMVLERLARQLRDDAHGCENAAFDSSDAKAKDIRPILTLSANAPHTIRYTVGERSIARDETKRGQRVRHESYALERDQTARFELIEESGHKLVRLVVTREPGKNRAEPLKPLEFVAALGKHRTHPISIAKGGTP